MTRVIRLITITLAMLLLAGCEKYELDRRMEELCKKDGGVRVYETVKLPASMFDQNGDPFPGWRGRPEHARLGTDYRLLHKKLTLKDGDPDRGQGLLAKDEWQVIRVTSGEILGEGVSYGRSGGDFIALGHFTSKSCPQQFGEAVAVVRAVFTKEEN